MLDHDVAGEVLGFLGEGGDGGGGWRRRGGGRRGLRQGGRVAGDEVHGGELG